MTDRHAIIEALAIRFENYRLGKDGFTSSEAAAAVLELVGPRQLLWKPSTCLHLVWICQGTTTNQYRIALDDIANEYSVLIDGCLNWHPTLESAQSAAQAHADAAHWANTKIGGE